MPIFKFRTALLPVGGACFGLIFAADLLLAETEPPTSNSISNLPILSSAAKEGQIPAAQNWQALFDSAQKQREQKNYPEASRYLTTILEGKSPEDLKRSAFMALAT